jgi:hypothetical protein
MRGRLYFSSMHSSNADDVASIQVTDDVSGTSFLRIEMSMEDFALSLLNHQDREIEFTLWCPERIGKKHERKTESVFVSVDPFKRDQKVEISDAIRPFEVDGWIGSRRDAENHHNVTKTLEHGFIAEVGFDRYVEEK